MNTTDSERGADAIAAGSGIEPAHFAIISAEQLLIDGAIAAYASTDEREAETPQPAPGTALITTADSSYPLLQQRTHWLKTKLAYERYEVIFRNHHLSQTTALRGPYEHYRLVYRYGYELGTDARYARAEWTAVEHDARPRWEERNPGTWGEFKETIEYAWNTSRLWQDS